jgi:hypothetical protein
MSGTAVLAPAELGKGTGGLAMGFVQAVRWAGYSQ